MNARKARGSVRSDTSVLGRRVGGMNHGVAPAGLANGQRKRIHNGCVVTRTNVESNTIT